MKISQAINAKIERALGDGGFDCVIAFGYDNVQYLSGAYLHFPQTFPDQPMALFRPKQAAPVCILPALWESSFRNLSWITETCVYEQGTSAEVAIEAVAGVVSETLGDSGTIGVDARRISAANFENLSKALGEFELLPCDDWLSALRMVKTPEEIACLEDTAMRTDHAFNGAAHHILVTSLGTEMGESESIRIHAIERDLDEIGHHAIAQSVAGTHAHRFWPNAPRYGVGSACKGNPGELMRMELNASRDGYWSTGARMLVLGEPDAAQRDAYAALVALREAARTHLRPGVTAAEVHAAVMAAAHAAGVKLASGLPVGHGIGVSPCEPPYLSAADRTVLTTGMVLVLSPIVIGPRGELMMGRDTVVITESGNRLMGWYKDWREPFIANFSF
jgi:Xaa-Pro dipeptidase